MSSKYSPVFNEEIYSVRKSLTMKPSVDRAIKQYAEAEGISVNKAINRAIMFFVRDMQRYSH